MSVQSIVRIPRRTSLNIRPRDRVVEHRRPRVAGTGGVDLAFITRLERIARFRQATGRLPREDDRDGSWLRHRRNGQVTDAQAAAMDDLIPGWRETAPRNPAIPFEAHIRGIRSFVARHGRTPTRSEPHGAWLAFVRAGGIVLTSERVRALDLAAPGWRRSAAHAVPDRTLFTERVARVADFRARHGRLPFPSEPDGAWLVSQRKRRIPAARRAILDRELPGWDVRRPLRRPRIPFADHVAQVAAFLAEHGRFPTRTEPHGVWFANVRRYIRLTPDRVALLDRELPGWADPLPGSKGVPARPVYAVA